MALFPIPKKLRPGWDDSRIPPSEPVEVDWDNPLTYKLENLWMARADKMFDLIKGNHGTYGTGVKKTAWYLDSDGSAETKCSSTVDHTGDQSIWAIFRCDNTPGTSSNSGIIHKERNGHLSWDHGSGSSWQSAFIWNDGGWKAADFGAHLANTWYNWLATLDGSNARAYSQGKLISTTAGGHAQADLRNPEFLGNPTSDGASRRTAGEVTIVGQWSRVLSAAEAHELYVNPWQILRPKQELLYFVTSGGATTYTKTTSLDAILQDTSIKTVSLDAILQDTSTLTTSIDAVLRDTILKTTSLDAALKDTSTKTTSLDAALKDTSTKTTSLDAILQDTTLKTTSLDAILQDTSLLTASLDAVLLQQNIALTTSLDAVLIEAGNVLITSLDAALQKLTTQTTSLDAILKDTSTKTTSLDAVLSALKTLTTSLDAVIQKVTTLTASLDAALSKSGNLVTSSLDAVLAAASGGIVLTFGVDSLVDSTQGVTSTVTSSKGVASSVTDTIGATSEVT